VLFEVFGGRNRGNSLLHALISIVQVVTTLVLVVLMAVQTDKAEQGGGGVMGLGAASGRTSGNINLPVGAERILKPLTAWAAFGFLASSILNAIPDKVLTIGHVLVVLVIYIIGMLFAGRIWAAITGALGR
jgi:preprotein translocase subunit SecG